MINIDMTYPDHYLDSVAEEWWKDVVQFLTEEHLYPQDLYWDNAGHRNRFTTRLEKGEYIVKHSGKYQESTPEQKAIIDDVFSEFCKLKGNYILADENRLKLLKRVHDKFPKELIGCLNQVFAGWYVEFTSNEDIAYKYMKKLHVRTCPYCNRNYIFTIERIDKKSFKTRPEFDHFYDKSHYPILALSFYNLVPSCHTCNHGKLTGTAGINPFFKGYTSRFYITHPDEDRTKAQAEYKPMNVNEALGIKGINDFSLALPTATPEEESNINIFGLNELYNEHKDYVLELIDKANAYNAIGAQNLIEAFQGIGHSPQDVFDFVWGKNLNGEEQANRPLSKLTNDILAQLGI